MMFLVSSNVLDIYRIIGKQIVCVCVCVCVCTISASHWKNKSVLYFPPDSVVNYKTWLVIWNSEHLILQK